MPVVSPRPIRRWLISIAGFRQERDQQIGMVDLWLRWRQAWVDKVTSVEMYEWDDDVEELANRIKRYSSDPDIVVAGYSWGGMAAVNLCDKLRERTLSVRHLLLTDAVYRHWFPLGNWRAMTKYSQIVVPANVERVTWFRQKNNWPRGHDVVMESQSTKVSGPHDAGTLKHASMDEYSVFQRCCAEAGRPLDWRQD